MLFVDLKFVNCYVSPCFITAIMKETPILHIIKPKQFYSASNLLITYSIFQFRLKGLLSASTCQPLFSLILKTVNLIQEKFLCTQTNHTITTCTWLCHTFYYTNLVPKKKTLQLFFHSLSLSYFFFETVKTNGLERRNAKRYKPTSSS